jgi:putative endonuclease
LYTGVTSNLANRLHEHFEARGKPVTFAGKYFCFNLIYYEQFHNINHAIEREKEIKGWRREKKEQLIAVINVEWRFLNSEAMEL